jgi:hypothetical protein
MGTLLSLRFAIESRAFLMFLSLISAENEVRGFYRQSKTRNKEVYIIESTQGKIEGL